MQLLIFLNPEFWQGVIIAAWAMYGPAILAVIVVLAFVGLLVACIIQKRRTK